MIRSRQKWSILVITIISLFLFPSFGTAKPDLIKTPITLNLSGKTTGEILKEIEKQTNYTFEILDFCEAETLDETLNNNRSIVLDQTPLDQALNRLLKDFNYSIISNENQKSLTLVLLNKENGSIVASQNNGVAAVVLQSDSMDNVTAAFEEFDNQKGKRPTADLEEQEETTMDGVTAAFEELENNNGEQPYLDQQQEETTMDGVTAAFEELENYNGEQSIAELQHEETTMDDVEIAFEEFNNHNSVQSLTDQQAEKTTMDGVTAAFNAYEKAKINN